jgi:hypothetical protein
MSLTERKLTRVRARACVCVWVGAGTRGEKCFYPEVPIIFVRERARAGERGALSERAGGRKREFIRNNTPYWGPSASPACTGSASPYSYRVRYVRAREREREREGEGESESDSGGGWEDVLA